MNSILKTASIFVGLASLSAAAFAQGWPQWSQNPQYTGYDAPNYCFPVKGIEVPQKVCVTAPKGPFYITQVDRSMKIEWQFQNTSTDAMHDNGFA